MIRLFVVVVVVDVVVVVVVVLVIPFWSPLATFLQVTRS